MLLRAFTISFVGGGSVRGDGDTRPVRPVEAVLDFSLRPSVSSPANVPSQVPKMGQAVDEKNMVSIGKEMSKTNNI